MHVAAQLVNVHDISFHLSYLLLARCNLVARQVRASSTQSTLDAVFLTCSWTWPAHPLSRLVESTIRFGWVWLN